MAPPFAASQVDTAAGVNEAGPVIGIFTAGAPSFGGTFAAAPIVASQVSASAGVTRCRAPESTPTSVTTTIFQPSGFIGTLLWVRVAPRGAWAEDGAYVSRPGTARQSRARRGNPARAAQRSEHGAAVPGRRSAIPRSAR